MKSVSPDPNLQDLEQQGPAGESKSCTLGEGIQQQEKVNHVPWWKTKRFIIILFIVIIIAIAATVGGILGSRANKEDPSNVSSTSNSTSVENSNCAAGNTFCTCLSSYAATCASRKCCSGVCAVTTSAGFGAYGLCL